MSVDVCPWDLAELPEWREALSNARQQWQEDAAEALAQGGYKADQLEDLAEESEQYLWGDAPDEVAELAGRVHLAAAYVARVRAALKGQLLLEEVEALLAEDPKPVPDAAGLPKLKEGVEHARSWLERSQEFLSEERSVEWKALERFVAEANSIPVLLPEAKSLRERAAAARKLADALRSALPNVRGEGRRRGAEQLSMEELRKLQQQAVALRVEMPEQSSLALALDRVEVWQSRVRALTEMQAPLEELRELLEEAEGLPVAMPEVDRIQALIESAEAWQRQLEGLMRGRAAIKRMREVLAAGQQLGVDMPQVEELRLEIKKREWEDAARRSLSSRQTHTLTGLADLLSAASEVDAGHSALAQGLRQRIEVAESWEARAGDLLERRAEELPEARRPTVQDLHQLVSEGLALGIKMDRLSQLSSELERAVTWIQQARATLAKAAALESSQQAAGAQGSGDAAAAPAEGSDVAGMEVDEASGEGMEAADEGTSLAPSAAASQRASPEPSEASALAAVLLAAAEVHAAPSQPAAARATPPPLPALPALPALPTLPGMQKGKKKARQPKPKQPKGKDSSPLPELSVIESLLEQYKTLLVQAQDEAEGLRKLRSVADEWLEEARPVLEQDFVTDDQLGQLERLIASGGRVGLAMEQVEILKANVEALLWARKVRALLARLPAAAIASVKKQAEQPEAAVAGEPEQEQPVAAAQGEQAMQVDGQQEEGVQPRQAGAAAAPAEQEAEPAPPAEQQQQDEAADEPTEEELLAEDAAAQQLVAALPARVEAAEEQRGVAATCETLPFDQRLPLSDFMSLLEEGFILPCDEKLWGQLKGIVETAQEFNQRSAHVLTLGRDGASFANAIDADELQQLLLRADRLSIKLERLPILQDFLAGFRQWEEGMRALTQDASGAPKKPSFSALAAASATARSWPITSPLRALADDAVSKTVDWQERCRRLLAKRNTAARLDAALAAVAQSVDSAVDQFERRLDVEKRLVIAGSDPATVRNTPPAPGRAEDRDELYCLCQRPFDPQMAQAMPMLGCDTCGEWFHARCVGVTQSQMRSLRRFLCPVCLAIKGHTEALEGCVAKLQRTKRPGRDELAALLPEVEGLPVQPEEGELLGRVVRKFDRWKTATTRAVEVHEMSRTSEHAGSILQLSQGMLHCLLKSALALEIDATAYADKVLRLLRCNKWRERAEAAIKPPAKLTPDGVAKLLAEGERLGIESAKDVTGVKLTAEVAKAEEWAQRARAHVEELRAAKEDAEKFSAAAGRARELLKEGDGIGVRVEGAAEALQEHSKLHCLCKKPLLEAQAMVTCTYCQELYHHGCVGLKAPGSDGDGDEPPSPFRCPLCCMRMSTKYAHFHKLPEASLDALKQAALKLPPAPPSAAAAAAKAAPRPAAKATPKTPAMPVSFAGWPALPAMAATMAAAGIRPGMIPALPAGMTPEQLTAALTQMFQAGMAGGAGVPGMAAMVPGVGPGGQVGMFGVPPQLLALLQKQQAAALAQRAAQEQQQKAKQEGERKEGEQQGQGKASAAGAADGEPGASKPVKKRRKSGEQTEGAAGEPKPKKPRAKKAPEGGEGKPAGEGGDKPAPKRRKADKQAEGGKEAEGKQKQPAEGGKKKGQAAEAGGEAGSPEGAAKPAKKKRPPKAAPAAQGNQAAPEQQQKQQQQPGADQQQQQQQPAAEPEAAGDKAGGKKRRRSSRLEEPAAGPADAATDKEGTAAAPAAAVAGGEAKPAAKRKKPADKPQAKQEPSQQQKEPGQSLQKELPKEGEQKQKLPEGKPKPKEEAKQADKEEGGGKEEAGGGPTGAARRRSGRLQRP